MRRLLAIAGAVAALLLTLPAGAQPIGLGVINPPTAGDVATALGYTPASRGANTFTALQTITQGSANAGILASTGYSLTGSNTTSMASLAGTLNTSGVVDVLKLAITDTAHGASSNIINLLGGAGGATSLFKVDFTGAGTFASTITAGDGNFSTPAAMDVKLNAPAGQTARINADVISFQTAAASPVWAIDGSHFLKPSTNNVYDLGTAALKVRTGYYGTSIVNTGYYASTAPTTQTSTYSIAATDTAVIFNGAGSITVTLPTASTNTGRLLWLRTIAAQTVVSNASNVVPLVGGAAGTAILAATAGRWALLQSDGTSWQIMSGN